MKVFHKYEFAKIKNDYVKQYHFFLKMNAGLLVVNAIIGFYLVHVFLLSDPKNTPYYVSGLTTGIEPLTPCYVGLTKLGQQKAPNPSRYYEPCLQQFWLKE